MELIRKGLVMDIVKQFLNWINPPLPPEEAPKPVVFPEYVEPKTDWYEASLFKIEDGDTIKVVRSITENEYGFMTIRLYGVAVPEDETVEGREAKLFVINWMEEAYDYVGTDPLPLVICWIKHDKYGGRDNAIIYRKHDKACLNKQLINSGFGAPADKYGRRV